MRRWLGSGLAALLLLVVATAPIFAVDPVPATAGVPVTLTGTLEVVHGDDFQHGRPEFSYALRTKTGRVELAFSGQGPRDLGGARIRVSGRRAGDTVTVAADESGAVEQVAAAPATSVETATAAAPVTKAVAVILINFSNDTSQPITRSGAAGIVFSNANSVANFFAEESRDAVSLTGTVFGWYTIPASNANCAWDTWRSQAVSAANAAGANLAAYNHVIYAWPHTSSCGWAGLAFMPGRDTFNNGAFGLRVIGHELSHNFGIHHASSVSCTSGGVRVAVSSSCSASEYGDPFTIMGSGSTFHNDGEQVGELGWLQAGEVRTVVPGGSYSIEPVLGTHAGTVKLLRVARGDGTWFYIDVRAPFGSYFDRWGSADLAVNGVMIRISPDAAVPTSSPRVTKLVDTHPETATFSDAPLAVGRTLVDSVSHLRITTESLDAGGAVVRIVETVAPSAPGSLSAAAMDETTVDLAWTQATDNVAVAAYRVVRDGAAVATLPASATTFEDSGLTRSTPYAYAVIAVDSSGNQGPAATATVETGPPDTVPPTPPTDLVATGLSATSVGLTWAAGTDDVAVAGYRISRNGVAVATAAGTTWTDTGRAPTTTYEYQVATVDRAANASDAVTATATTLRDTTPPTRPGTLRKRTWLYKVRLSWTAARDNVRVAGYCVYRVGRSRPVAKTTHLTVIIRRVRGARYYVRAIDSSGNRSLRTNIVRIY
jgi:chitodextrinase